MPEWLETRAGKVKDVFSEDAFQRFMIRINLEGRQATQIEGALQNRPYNSQTLQLNGGVALLSGGESF